MTNEKKGFFRNKKGSFIDLILIAVFVFVFCITSLIVFMVVGRFNDEIQDNSQMDHYARNASIDGVNFFTGALDNSILFVMAMLVIGVLAMAALVRVHPFFIFLFIIVLAVFIFICGIFSNVYETMAENPQLSTYANQLTNISNIMTYLPFIIGIVGFLLAIVMYKGWQEAQL